MVSTGSYWLHNENWGNAGCLKGCYEQYPKRKISSKRVWNLTTSQPDDVINFSRMKGVVRKSILILLYHDEQQDFGINFNLWFWHQVQLELWRPICFWFEFFFPKWYLIQNVHGGLLFTLLHICKRRVGLCL